MKCDCAVCRGLSAMWDTLWSVTVLYAGDCPPCGIHYEVWLCCVQGTVQRVGYIMKCDCVVCRGLSSVWDTLWSVTVLYAGECLPCGIHYEASLCCVCCMQGTVQHVGYVMKCDCVVCRGLSAMWDTLWSVTVLCVLYAGDCPPCGIHYEVWLCCVQGTVRHVGYIMKCDCAVCRGLSAMWDTLWSVTVLCAGDCPPCGIHYEVWLYCVQGTAVPDLSSLVITPHNMCPSGTVLLDNCCSQSFFPTSPQALPYFYLWHYLTLPFSLPHFIVHLALCTSPLSWPHFTFILTSLHLYCSFSIISPFSWPHINFILTSHHLYLDLTLPFTWPHFTFYFTSLHLSLCPIFCSLEHDSSVCWASDPKARCITDMG